MARALGMNCILTEKETVLVGLLFFSLFLVFSLQTQYNENVPLSTRGTDKELLRVPLCFSTCLNEEEKFTQQMQYFICICM